MRILIINIDSKLDNLALVKIEQYHLSRKDDIIWDLPLMADRADKIYVSCIFESNKDKALEYSSFPNAVIGGTGYDISKKLDPEIDKIKPKINIDFATRGCIRKCEFCVVPEKEGSIRADRDIYDIWDGRSKSVTLLDNNILALPDHFRLICSQAEKENLWIDFNQGLDFRLLDDDIIYHLSKTKIKHIRFALDYNHLIPVFKSKLEMLRKRIPNIYPFVYVLAGYKTSFEEDMERLLFLKSENCRPYLMRHQDIAGDKEYIKLAQWVNQTHIFAKYSFQDFKRFDKEQRLSLKKAVYDGPTLPY